MLNQFFKSLVEQDNTAIVICDLEHTIIYMNPVAVKQYEKRGGAALLGTNLMNCHNADSCRKIESVVAWFRADVSHNRVFTYFNEKKNMDEYMIALRDDDGKLIGYYEKHEYRSPETGARYDFS